MNPSDASGDKQGDARHLGDQHRRGNGGGAPSFLGDHDRQIPLGDFGDSFFFPEPFNFFRAHPDDDFPIDDADGRGNGPIFFHGLFHEHRGLHVPGIGHAMGNDRGFEGHDRLFLLQRAFDALTKT